MNKFNLTAIFLSIVLIVPASGQSKKSTYQYTINLTEVVDDKVKVELLAPRITSSEVTFFLPKIVGMFDTLFDRAEDTEKL